jgi:hypothetical protein
MTAKNRELSTVGRKMEMWGALLAVMLKNRLVVPVGSTRSPTHQ